MPPSFNPDVCPISRGRLKGVGCHGWTPQVVTGPGNIALLEEEGGCEKEGGGPGFVPEPLSESHKINTTRAKIFVHLQAVQLRHTPQRSLQAALLII